MRQRTAILLAFGADTGKATPLLSSGSEPSWAWPQETNAALMAEQQLWIGFSPKPTPPPVPRGHVGRMGLMRRLERYSMGPATCGFNELDGTPLTCITNTATCTSSDGFFGCCQPNEECSRIQTVCVDYTASQAGRCESPSDFHTVCCPSTAPECYTYLRTDPGSGGNITALACHSTSGTTSLLNYDPQRAWTLTFSPSSTAPFTPKSPSTAPFTSKSPSTAVVTQIATVTETSTKGGGGINVGAIAGGAVGGVAVLGLISAVAFLLRCGRRGNGNGPPTAQVQAPGPHAYSSPPQAHDAHMSGYDQGGYLQYPQHLPEQYYPKHPGGFPPYGAAPGFVTPSMTSPPAQLESDPGGRDESSRIAHGSSRTPAERAGGRCGNDRAELG